jgi:hypothetical protein
LEPGSADTNSRNTNPPTADLVDNDDDEEEQMDQDQFMGVNMAIFGSSNGESNIMMQLHRSPNNDDIVTLETFHNADDDYELD